jgi:putative endonuclease
VILFDHSGCSPIEVVMWYVYILLSIKNGKWYTGCTNDLRKRIESHNGGKNKSTVNGRPWKLIYYESGHNMLDARARERFLKSGQGKRYLRNRMKFFFAETSIGL